MNLYFIVHRVHWAYRLRTRIFSHCQNQPIKRIMALSLCSLWPTLYIRAPCGFRERALLRSNQKTSTSGGCVSSITILYSASAGKQSFAQLLESTVSFIYVSLIKRCKYLPGASAENKPTLRQLSTEPGRAFAYHRIACNRAVP